MRRWPFFWHIFPSFLLITLLACAFIIVYATNAARTYQAEYAEATLKTRAALLEGQLARLFTDTTVNADSLLDVLGVRTRTRITLIRPDGVVIADSHEEAAVMDNHGDRPEIIEAMARDTGVSTRYSATLEHDLLYTAIPVTRDDSLLGVLRTSLPLVSVYEALEVFASRLLATGIVVAVIVVLLSLAITHRLNQPLKELTRGAERFAQGDFSIGLPIPSTSENARLASAMNAMAEQLDERIRAIMRKSNEQDAILSAMVEGVIAVDQDEHVIMINQAAGAMLGVNPMEVKGRWIQEAVRNTELQKFIGELLRKRTPLNRQITAAVAVGGERTLEVHGTVLRGSRGGLNGVLVALHDITHLRKLENLRREFVANVSHELRTPLTSIKGFVETLLDGALDQPGERERFMEIIGNHVNRLNALVEDLFTLSRLEKDEANGGVELQLTSVDALVKDAVEVCTAKAVQKNVRLSTVLGQVPSARVNTSLFEQAIINLIDNAIKYSEAGTQVEIRCERRGNEIAIAVVDEGPGIPQVHQTRLFERFYRIDKARSSKLGGTGLGLSIVKHIMNVHNGTITVDSTIGEGSTFTLFVPAVGATEEKS
ncbi:MAG: HAMP domain-containing protein [Chitinivibrionales bacterium]|nr:HAMP domain-containing protein [Chitinivibrionales bacterium]